MRGIVWFKKDLRMTDNPALFHASKHCHDGIIAVYIIDISMWKLHHVSHCQIEFILRGLEQLSEDLKDLHIPLIIKQVDATADIPDYLLELAQAIQAEKVFLNYEYEVNESKRDQAVAAKLAKHQITTEFFHDQLILPHETIRTGQDDYFKVFTAFKRQWIKQYRQRGHHPILPKPEITTPIKMASTPVPRQLAGIHSDIEPTLWPAGERVALAVLQTFIEENIFSYDSARDFPGLDRTSKLSPYLATGMISIRECFVSACAANAGELDTGNTGALTWMSELIWREFYRHILIYVPRVCLNKAYKIQTESLPWRYNKDLLRAWQEGMTGFPIVDAAMRQLNQTGWMHNRLRMVAAMFLSKNLFLDWRLGEKYFSEKLIDIDFASNNGGWQWSASTGTDAVPYFRIFSPLSQSQRFDPKGDFIRQYCPELKEFDARSIHDPHVFAPLLAVNTNYPTPVIDYKQSRIFALNAFKNLI